MSFDELYFRGHEPRRCGEHRTVGAHRAFCLDDNEWCYPSSSCAGCGPTREDLEARAERYRLAWMSARRRRLGDSDFTRPPERVEMCYNDGPPHPRTECHVDRCGLDPIS